MRINLLSDKYGRAAAFDREVRRTAGIVAVIFLLWILIVLSMAVTERILQTVVYVNQERLQSAELLDAGRMAELAAQAKSDDEYYEILGGGRSISTGRIFAAIGQMHGVTADEILADSEQRTIAVSGRVLDKEQLNQFVKRLTERFGNVNLSVLERVSDGYFQFTVLITGEDGQ